ncbi:uncharacterized coiled-coil DUF342 family protein [Methanohalophilus levihalophilus]|uniref:DUF7109 family protein n=1 Tax=Methanohalophilus levihalophilus TaxID=1431282 RepID=UPI001AE6427A|nr:hypothetical protein [Methanohalophilus levihalophilus]MBP2030463.1 uncharacterized coiled-coil DUF342 family protein [Methanohalophilus levihalophilus]
MISEEEIVGILDALGAVTFEEIKEIVHEIEFLNEDEKTIEEELEKLCNKAKSKHWIEVVSYEEIEDMSPEAMENPEEEFFISGPDAFPEYPKKLSEALDILKLHKRELDREKLIHRFARRLKMQITRLSNKIKESPADGETLEKLDRQYSDLLNLYYDYDSWIPEAFAELEEDVLKLGSKLESLKNA